MTSIATEAPSLAVSRQPRRARRARVGRSLPYLLLAPSLLLLAAFTYLPIVRVLWDSLHDKVHGARTTHFVGLDNYSRLFADKAFIQSVVNNIVYAAATVPMA